MGELRVRRRLQAATASLAAFAGTGLVFAVGTAPAGAAHGSSHAATSPSSSLHCAAGLGTGSPGVTAKQVNVAAISSLTGPISAGFSAVVPGVQAYFDTVNAHGGVNGRKMNLAYNLNDEGTGSRFETETHTAIDQDHAFAVIASSYWFTPTYFASTCTPTYGFNVTGDWTGPPNLFAAGGSVQTYSAGAAQAERYLVKQVHAKSVGVLAYGVSSSANACQADVNGLEKAGIPVSYSDLKVTPLNPNVTPDVQRMASAGTGLIVSCMTVNGNIEVARAAKQYGLKAKLLFFTIINQSVLNKESNLLQGAYFTVESVPPLANQKYPGTTRASTPISRRCTNTNPPTRGTTTRCWDGSQRRCWWPGSRGPGTTSRRQTWSPRPTSSRPSLAGGFAHRRTGSAHTPSSRPRSATPTSRWWESS